jgi:MFS family permease
MAFAYMMMPLCNTIYLPALVAIKKDLKTTSTATAASVAIYLFTVGVAALVWGPAADRWGRKAVLRTSSALFLGFSLGCALSPNITALIVLRALQVSPLCQFGDPNC